MENGTQPNISLVQQLPQTPTPLPKHTIWTKILLAIFLGFMVIAASVFIGIQIGNNQIETQRSIIIQPAISPTPMIVSPSVDWKTYDDTIITFKYPNGWSTEDLTWSMQTAQTTLDKDLRFIYDNYDQEPRTFDLIIVRNPIGIVSQDFKDTKVTALEGDFGAKTTDTVTVTKSNAQINDLQVIKVYSTYVSDDNPSVLPNTYYTVLIPMGSRTVEFSSNKKDHILLDQILSTFKITN